MLLEDEDNRQKRFKAMLQYLILREACEFDDRFPTGVSGAGDGDGVEVQSNKDEFKTESAKKILSAMESKFLDFFVDDDLVENLFLHDDSEKGKIGSKRNEIERPKTISEDEQKKLLLDKLSVLEKQLEKYKNEDKKHSSSSPPLHSVKEHFQSYLSSNQNQTPSISMNQDFMDLTLLIVIGFVFIFFLDTVFQMGKKIGQRKI
jgi:hypothetical protein